MHFLKMVSCTSIETAVAAQRQVIGSSAITVNLTQLVLRITERNCFVEFYCSKILPLGLHRPYTASCINAPLDLKLEDLPHRQGFK